MDTIENQKQKNKKIVNEQDELAKFIRKKAMFNLTEKGTKLKTTNSVVKGLEEAYNYQSSFKKAIMFLTSDFMAFTSSWGNEVAKEFLLNTDFEKDFKLQDLKVYQAFFKDWEKELSAEALSLLMPAVDGGILETLRGLKMDLMHQIEAEEIEKRERLKFENQQKMAKVLEQAEEKQKQEQNEKEVTTTIKEQQEENLDPKKLKH